MNELQPAKGTPGKNVGIDVRPYPGGAVMVFTRQNTDGSQARVLRLWVQRGNEWQLAAHQGTAISDQPVAAATNPSSPLPGNAGPAADVKAVEAAIESLAASNAKADAKTFAASVTERFFAIITRTGEVRSKEQRIQDLLAGPPSGPAPTMAQGSTRIYDDLAVTNRLMKGATGRAWTMIIHVRQDGKWLRAGVITTPTPAGT